MTKLVHTHQDGGKCLACDFSLLEPRESLPSYAEAYRRVEAALAERGHLEYGARFLAGMLKRAEADGLLVPEAAAWLEAERARKGTKG